MKNLLRKLADNSNPDSWAVRFRRNRARHAQAFIESWPEPRNILDVGGTENFWVKSGLHTLPGIKVTLLNRGEQKASLANFTSISGDARDLSRFADKSFDIVFSNSVIEHVGSIEDQQSMAREIQRVGKSYFVQTPARSFPIEPHFLFPFFAQLPDRIREELVMRFNLGWYKKILGRDEAKKFLHHFQLLDKGQLESLFPGAKITHERFLGLTKSYMVISQ